MRRNAGRLGFRLKRAAVLLLLPMLAACSWMRPSDGAKTHGAIDPPPADVEEMMLRQAEGLSAAPDGTQNVTQNGTQNQAAAPASPSPTPDAEMAPEEMLTVYLLDPKGYLAPMTLPAGTDNPSAMESLEARAEAALSWLTADPQKKDQLPYGFAAPLPEGVKAEEVRADPDSGMISVDFTDPLPVMTAAGERKMIEALVWSMTELPGIDKVRLSVRGELIRTLPASGLPLEETLTRGIGINIESLRGVHVADSMAVTLYFPVRGDGGDGYFVPVTRLVSRSPDRTLAALEALMDGPADTAALARVWTNDFAIEDLEVRADTVNVSLRGKGWTRDQPLPAEMLDSLVLTATEAAGAPRVKIAVNGNETFVDTENRAYQLPVNRPAAVNTPKS